MIMAVIFSLGSILNGCTSKGNVKVGLGHVHMELRACCMRSFEAWEEFGRNMDFYVVISSLA